MNATALYQQYQLMIKKFAYKYARKYGFDVEELEAQGNLLFVEALEDYNPDKGAEFGTFLWHRLTRINDYCRSMILRERVVPHTDLSESEELALTGAIKEYDLPKVVNSVKLTDDAREMLSYLLGFNWHNEDVKQPTIHRAVRYFRAFRDWPKARTETAWAEVAGWYQAGMVA